MCARHPVYGFYTQLTTEEWWRKTFLDTVTPLVDYPNKSDLEAAFQFCFNNFEYELMDDAEYLLENLAHTDAKLAILSNGDERLKKVLEE